ncbi:MAG: hypothetical protein KJT03_11360, partial [Verrucomicrobiae bacterium]|nr:hypothetical protein [Verrucomicrobiae bacterium]
HATKLIIMIHGWNPDSHEDPFADNNPSIDEGGEFVDLYQNLITQTENTDWEVFRYDWAADADTGSFNLLLYEINPTEAAEHGHQHGWHLGDLLVEQNPELLNVHFIAHSAGSWVARGTARNLLDLNPNIRVQVTLLDPFMPAELLGNDASLGKDVMSVLDEQLTNTRLYKLENYYAVDSIIGTRGTQEEFSWRPQSDINFRTDMLDAPLKYDEHSGPIQWYADTVANTPSQKVTGLEELYDLASYGWRQSMFSHEPVTIESPIDTTVAISETINVSSIVSTRDETNYLDGQSPPITFQWLKWNGSEWENLPDQTNQDLIIQESQESDAGHYGLLAANTAGVVGTNVVEVSVVPQSYFNWISEFAALPSDEKNPSDDFDQDGHSNLLEYSFALNPTVPNDIHSLINTSANEESLDLSYEQKRDDVTYIVETSTDLTDWTTDGINHAQSEIGQVTASVLIGPETRRFLRLRVELL